jgi:hypothetical protein
LPFFMTIPVSFERGEIPPRSRMRQCHGRRRTSAARKKRYARLCDVTGVGPGILGLFPPLDQIRCGATCRAEAVARLNLTEIPGPLVFLPVQEGTPTLEE